jgi:uncharacterized protein YjbJ (UPF0337 family)
MNNDQIHGRFDQIKGELKRRWGQLTDDDITEAKGDMQKLMGKIRAQSGDSEESVREWFKSQGVD